MSLELVMEASRSSALDPTPPPDALAAAHVPFKLLTGEDIESDVQGALESFDRLSIVAPTGAGKSSLARYVLRPGDHNLAPIWINVATEDHDKVSNVRGFLSVLGGQLLARAERAERVSKGERRDLLRRLQRTEPLGKDESRLRGELGGSYWLLSGKVAREVSKAVEHPDSYRATVDLEDAVKEALAIVSDTQMVPVLVADDTDRLLKVGADEEASERLFQGFFGEVLREITEQLNCALLVAAHDRYSKRDDYREMTEGLLRPILLPEFKEPSHFGHMITSRLEEIDSGASWRQILEEPALDRLCQLHLGVHKRSVRRTLAALREALGLAASQGAPLVTVGHLDGASAGEIA